MLPQRVTLHTLAAHHGCTLNSRVSAVCMQAELARKETREINSQILDITRKNVSLAQDVKDAQHELTAVRSSAADSIAAAEARVATAEERAREAAARLAEAEASLQEATAACERMRKEAEAASAIASEQGHDLRKLKVRPVVQSATCCEHTCGVCLCTCPISRRSSSMAILAWGRRAPGVHEIVDERLCGGACSMWEPWPIPPQWSLTVRVGAGQAALQTATAERDRLDTELSQANEEFAAQAREHSAARGARDSAQEELQAAHRALEAERHRVEAEQRRTEAAIAESRAAKEQQEVLEGQLEALQVCSRAAVTPPPPRKSPDRCI